MKDWKVAIRGSGLVERVCEHGVGHPDPDSLVWMNRIHPNGMWEVHGCCGCCMSDEERSELFGGAFAQGYQGDVVFGRGVAERGEEHEVGVVKIRDGRSRGEREWVVCDGEATSQLEILGQEVPELRVDLMALAGLGGVQVTTCSGGVFIPWAVLDELRGKKGT